jgi:hypothetical protein
MSFYDPCNNSWAFKNTTLKSLFWNTIVGGVGGFFTGFFAKSDSIKAILMGIGIDILINLANYSNASSCKYPKKRKIEKCYP